MSKIILSETILPNMSENFKEMKPTVKFENFRKSVARARNSQLCGSMTFESHNVDNVMFSIFGKVTSIPEILGLFTNVVWQ